MLMKARPWIDHDPDRNEVDRHGLADSRRDILCTGAREAASWAAEGPSNHTGLQGRGSSYVLVWCVSVSLFLSLSIYIYIYTCVCIYIYTYIYIYRGTHDMYMYVSALTCLTQVSVPVARSAEATHRRENKHAQETSPKPHVTFLNF